ncbi:MAG TPA: hypothetical protein VFJ07_06710, partial [Streptosporangiaceae bacterium]|nr:hypothetical protein [Streptosporangiaceae bacterium]
MDEPRDDIDTWLETRVTPLQPHPGTFEQIRKRARRRKAGRAALTAAGAVVVLAGAITVPRLILNGPVGSTPIAQTGPTTPAQRSSTGPGKPTGTGTPGPTDRSATPTPTAPPPVPPNFAASSVTFVSTTTGWVIGQAGTPGQCGPPKAYDCTSVAITNDGGSTWHGSHAPVTGAPNGATGAGQIRSLDGVSAWAFGPQLYATHDGGQTWAHIPTDGMRVTGLETVNGIVYAVWARCAGTGADFAADCTSFSLYSSPAGHDDWSPVPGATGLQASGGAPGSAQLVLTGTTGYLMAPGGQLFSGPVTRPARWRTVTTAAGIPVALPCAPGAGETGGHPLQAMLASTGPGLVLLCADQASGSRQAKTLYYSADGGRTWSTAGPAPARGIAMSLSGTPTGPVLVATSGGIDFSTNAPGASGALAWRTARGATAAGGYSYVG